jgi:hypothetical protein
MSSASNHLEDKLLDHVLRYSTAPYTAPSTVYVALFADSGSAASAALESGTSATGSGNANWGHFEINNASYARQSVTFAAAGASTTGTISTNSTVSFPVASANYETAGTTGNVVTHIALMDNSTGGNVLFYGALTTSKTVSSGDQFTISSGNLSISLA